MLSFHHSLPIYSVSYPGSPRSYPSSRPMVADSEARYRRALAEYLYAEGEYEALLRAREQAKLRARVEEALRRQELARLLRVEISRARREQQAQELERTLAKDLSREDVSKNHRSLRDIAPVICGTSRGPRQDTLVFPFPHAHASRTGGAGAEKESPESLWGMSAVRSSAEDGPPQHDANENEGTKDNKPQPFTSEPDEYSVPNLESLLRDRLQKVVGDEEVQDVARAILRHLTPETGVDRSTKANTSCTQPSEGCDLSRSDALQGAAAEAAKESFRAHRAEVAEREEPSAPSRTSGSAPSSLKIIQDIRSALAKLSSGFSFPPSLDFTDDEPNGLAFTPTNAPLRVYEHALDGLLAQLDAVESDGDEEVRVERRAAVKEVEKAIEDVARRVTEAKEGAKQGSSVDAAISPEDHPVKDEDEQVVLPVGPSEDGLDPGFSSAEPQVEASSQQKTEVVLPHDMDPIPGEDVLRDLRDQSSSPALESIPQAVFVATPTVTPTDFSPVPSGDSFASRQGASADQETTDRFPSATLESLASTSATSLELPAEVSTAIIGAIAPSSTPVSPTLTSSDITEDLLASLSREPVFLSRGSEGEEDLESDSSSAEADNEREWIEVGEL